MTAEPTDPPLRVGRVIGAHGVRGEVRVEPLTDFPDRFRPGAQVDVDGRSLTISAVSGAGPQLLVRFREVADREQAAGLQGAYLTVPLREARALPEGHFYHFQLVGLRVRDRQGRDLGRVEEVLEYPANDVLRVSGGPGGEVLVPMVRAVVQSVDLAGGVIEVDLPEATEA